MANHSTTAAYVTPESVPAMAYAGRPVVTTALLALLYGAKVKQIQNNFGRNQDRFESGKHFFKVEGAELVSLRPSFGGAQIPAKARSLILWTERGAARHAKMLETNEAWDVFEKLEDCYFGKSEVTKALPAPASQTLIGTTIGTDGFHCLAAVVDGKVRHLPAPYRRGAKNHIWSQVHKAFSVVSVEDIPANQMDSVRNFIGAYALEGEWLPRERKAERLPIDWPAERLAELNPHVYGRFSSSDPRIGVPLKGLCGMDSKSPTLRLLGTLSRNGYEVDACRIEVLAMRHHLESYWDISMQMHGMWEHRDERSITFKIDETAKSLRTDGVRGF
ncbi:hypothetical protein A9C11_11030 [Pseudomonas citronellolis]|uniref:KilA-N DNA-binding domain-containing protein n=2 Tax=Pseudomonas citronellolis TaxID=53408 RepID=A0A1A9KAF1_9PSED|nr:hypothetical protein A9C11_11030 [Pseudomonas citronellolis]